MSDNFCFYHKYFVPLNEAVVPVSDLGLQRGYGVFDFLRVTENVPLYIDDHLERFCQSAKFMRLPLQQTQEDLKQLVLQLIHQNQQPHSGIRILLTGGDSQDGYQIKEPRLVIIQQPITPPADDPPARGYRLVSYSHQRQMPHVKTTDYLMAIWLQPWVKEKNADDILYHQNGWVSECPRSNFFMVTGNDTLVTANKNILEGVTRKQILQLACLHQLKLELRDISLEEIRLAKEAFISSSTKRLIPVVKIDETELAPFSKTSVTAFLYDQLLQKEKTIIRG